MRTEGKAENSRFVMINGISGQFESMTHNKKKMNVILNVPLFCAWFMCIEIHIKYAILMYVRRAGIYWARPLCSTRKFEAEHNFPIDGIRFRLRDAVPSCSHSFLSTLAIKLSLSNMLSFSRPFSFILSFSVSLSFTWAIWQGMKKANQRKKNLFSLGNDRSKHGLFFIDCQFVTTLSLWP